MIHHPSNQNLGVGASLNLGIEHIKEHQSQFDYILRFDSDDVNYLERFETQIQFMELNQSVDICGSNIEVFNDANPLQYRLQTYHSHDMLVKYHSIYSCPFAHPTVVFRASSLDKIPLYDPNEKHMEDYKLWLDLLFSHPNIKVHNIGQVLLKHRKHKSSTLE